jgi:O-antigen ligase
MLCLYSGVEAAFDMPLNRLDEPTTATGILERNPGKGVSILVALAWAGIGALLAARGRWRIALAAALAATTGALALQFHMAANAAGFLAGLGGFALGWLAPRLGPTVVSGVIAAWLLLAPWLTPMILALPGVTAGLPASWRMRGEIWRFASARIAERPLTGWGLDSARQFSDTILTLDGLPFHAIPLHPHSFSIHVWLETGAVGALLLAAAIVAGGRTASAAFARSRPAAAALTAAMAAVAVIWNVSYGAWQEWWFATAFLAVAWTGALRRL